MLPIDIEQSLKQDFHFPEVNVFCQMATLSENSPHIRTVRLYGIEPEGLIFITRTTSKKWNELKNCSSMAICFLHPDCQIQLRAECKASLFSQPISETTHLEHYWNLVRDDVKKIYQNNYIPNVPYQNPQVLDVPTAIPDCWGLIVATPSHWEYLCVDADYPNSVRYVYEKNAKGIWGKQRLTVA